MQRLSKILVIAAAAALPFKYGPIYAWPFVLLILAAAALKLASVISNGIRNESRVLFFGVKIILLFFFFVAAGSVNNWFIYGANSATPKNTAIDFFLMGIYATGFLLILSYGTDEKFRKGVLAALMSPLVFAPFVFMPEMAKKLNFVSGVNMFEGLQRGEPTSFASVMLVPFAVLVAFFMKETGWKKFLCLFGIVLSGSLIFWSGVRSSWFAAGFSALIIVISELRNKINRLKCATTTLSLLTASAVISFLILPQDAQISILNRIFPQVTDYTYSEEIIRSISLSEAFNKISRNHGISFPFQHRDLIWPQAAKLFARNPFGLGPEYHVSSRAIVQDGQITKAHNIFLEIGLQGGIGAIAVYLFFIWKIVLSLKNARDKNREWLILYSAFSSLFIIAFVNGVFFTNDLFIAGLILSLKQTAVVPDGGKE